MMKSQTVRTALDVLFEGKQRIGASLSSTPSGQEFAAIYSFSDKQPTTCFAPITSDQ